MRAARGGLEQLALEGEAEEEERKGGGFTTVGVDRASERKSRKLQMRAPSSPERGKKEGGAAVEKKGRGGASRAGVTDSSICRPP